MLNGRRIGNHMKYIKVTEALPPYIEIVLCVAYKDMWDKPVCKTGCRGYTNERGEWWHLHGIDQPSQDVIAWAEIPEYEE